MSWIFKWWGFQWEKSSAWLGLWYQLIWFIILLFTQTLSGGYSNLLRFRRIYFFCETFFRGGFGSSLLNSWINILHSCLLNLWLMFLIKMYFSLKKTNCKTKSVQARLSHRRLRVVRIETTVDTQRIVGLLVPNAAVETVLQGSLSKTSVPHQVVYSTRCGTPNRHSHFWICILDLPT